MPEKAVICDEPLNSVAGRFLQRDPSGMVDGPNLYVYVGNNPWSFTDPLGLEAQALPMWQDPVSIAIIILVEGPNIASSAFRPGGWLNRGPWLRVGFGQHQGRRVFRVAGKVLDWVVQRSGAKIDFWKGGPV